MLVTLADTKTFLGINNNTQDSVLTMLINQASAYIEKKCGRTFGETTYTNEEYDGTGKNELKLNQFPVILFSQLQRNRATDNSDDWVTIDAEKYWIDLIIGIITKTSSFLEFDNRDDDGLTESTTFNLGKNKYRVTYTAGFAEIPYDIQYACMLFVSEINNKRKSGGIKSETLGDHSVTFESIFKSSPEIQDIINNYREINI